MISRVIFCLLFFASFGLSEDLEFRGFRKNELVLITLNHSEVISYSPLIEKDRSTEYVFCKILEVTPSHLKVKTYYRIDIPVIMSADEKEELKKKAKIRQSTVMSFKRASIHIIEGWGSNSDFPKPGPFDLW
jgi:hypothetical protein